jgi:hypothetical protein
MEEGAILETINHCLASLCKAGKASHPLIIDATSLLREENFPSTDMKPLTGFIMASQN